MAHTVTDAEGNFNLPRGWADDTGSLPDPILYVCKDTAHRCNYANSFFRCELDHTKTGKHNLGVIHMDSYDDKKGCPEPKNFPKCVCINRIGRQCFPCDDAGPLDI